MTQYLRVDDLSVRYGRVRALEHMSLDMGEGEVLAVLGRNGAGKSSLLRALAGMVRPSTGRIWWQGEDITSLAPHKRVIRGMVMIPEGRRIFPALTVRENLVLGGFQLRKDRVGAALEQVFSLFPLLKERASSPAGQLSGGQQRMLAVGRALMLEPRMLLLDEPSLGLAPRVVDELYRRLGDLRSRGITILLVEQHVTRALAFAEQAVVLNLGRVVLRDDPARLAQDPRLVGAYIGEGTP